MKYDLQILDTREAHKQILQTIMREQWSDRKQHALNWDYHFATDTRDPQPCSVVCYLNDKPLAIALAVNIEGNLEYFGSGICFSFAKDAQDKDAIASLIFDKFAQICQSQKLRSIALMCEPCTEQSLTQFEIKLLNQGLRPEPIYFAIVDLTNDEATLKSDIRKSYKSLVNFGKREINLMIETGENASEARFEAYHQFHIKTAGRETRPQESWDEMFKLVKSGIVDMAYGYYQDQLVSCSYLPQFNGTTLYGSGVYERELFDKPISHWPIYNAMMHSKARGDKYFDLGEVYLPASASPKEQNIAYFKKGFTSRVECWNTWKLLTVQ